MLFSSINRLLYHCWLLALLEWFLFKLCIRQVPLSPPLLLLHFVMNSSDLNNLKLWVDTEDKVSIYKFFLSRFTMFLSLLLMCSLNLFLVYYYFLERFIWVTEVHRCVLRNIIYFSASEFCGWKILMTYQLEI